MTCELQLVEVDSDIWRLRGRRNAGRDVSDVAREVRGGEGGEVEEEGDDMDGGAWVQAGNDWGGRGGGASSSCSRQYECVGSEMGRIRH